MTMQVSAEQIATLAAEQGPFWFWIAADETVYATEDQQPNSPDDVYLLRAPQAWIDQWNGDWQAAADQINEALQRRDQEV